MFGELEQPEVAFFDFFESALQFLVILSKPYKSRKVKSQFKVNVVCFGSDHIHRHAFQPRIIYLNGQVACCPMLPPTI